MMPTDIHPVARDPMTIAATIPALTGGLVTGSSLGFSHSGPLQEDLQPLISIWTSVLSQSFLVAKPDV